MYKALTCAASFLEIWPSLFVSTQKTERSEKPTKQEISLTLKNKYDEKDSLHIRYCITDYFVQLMFKK